MKPIDKNKSVHLVEIAVLASSTFHNGVAKTAPSISRGALIAGRDITHGILKGLSRTLSDDDVTTSNGILQETFGVANDQLCLLTRLQEAAYPSYDWSVEIEQSYKNCLKSLLINDSTIEEKEQIICVLEGAVERIDAFLIRTKIASVLLKQAADAIGIEWSDISVGKIQRNIYFPPESKQAAISTLNYFSHILEIKYPDSNIGVSIEQINGRVSLIVTTAEGEEDRIEKELDDYGLVVAGKISPEEYLENPYEAIALKQKLELAALELRQTKELMMSERTMHGDRITSLEDQVNFLRKLLDQGQYEKNSVIELLKTVSTEISPVARAALQKLTEHIEIKGANVDDPEVIQQFSSAVKEDRSILRRIDKLLIEGAIQGATGNYVYSWIQAVINTLPK